MPAQGVNHAHQAQQQQQKRPYYHHYHQTLRQQQQQQQESAHPPVDGDCAAPSLRHAATVMRESNCRTATISRAHAKSMYCLTNKDLAECFACQQRQSQPSGGRTSGVGVPTALLYEDVVREYALRKHGGTQEAILAALSRKHAARLHRMDTARANEQERHRRIAKVTSLMLDYCDHGLNVDWLTPSLPTFQRNTLLMPWRLYPEPMNRLVKYCRAVTYNMSDEALVQDVQRIAASHRNYEDRIQYVFRQLLQVCVCMCVCVCVCMCAVCHGIQYVFRQLLQVCMCMCVCVCMYVCSLSSVYCVSSE
jgi:hypothetical protein